MLQAELEEAVRGVVELMGSVLLGLTLAVSHEDPRRPDLQVLKDAMKDLTWVADNLASTHVGGPVGSLDDLDCRYRQHDYKMQQHIRAHFLMREVEDAVVMQLQDEVKELRRRLATLEEGHDALVELERAEHVNLAAQIQRMEEDIVAHKEYSALVHRDLGRNASEFRRFISRLEHALCTIGDDFEKLEERTKDWVIHTTYVNFLEECQHIFDEVVASPGCATTTVILRSTALQKSIRDGMNFAAVSLLRGLHGRVTGGSEVPGPEVADPEARIGDLERKILLHHDEVKLQADNLRVGLIDAKKLNELLKENLGVCQKHIKALKEIIDDREKHGILDELPSVNIPC
ncbi:hypothetical protein PR048_014662 [Dryococelus australis]|uniref:Uncharacterized protein n=1 Tax=Dryococelus australis TaxID=614101 RepID=A0ABQ9HFN3_9NEOP|nr:hypothetical protein PR048_014662 [Dryococelus australis]